MRPLFSGLSAERVQIYTLVLTASGIAHQVNQQNANWFISVHIHHRGAAVEAIGLFLKENPAQFIQGQVGFISSGNTYSAGYIVAILLLIHILIGPGKELQVFVAAFGADADRILDGEVYRCATALLFHSDFQHLAGNLVGLVIFGTVTASQCGWGIGWLMILATGIAGNLITALCYQQNHLAIGASTAVFGAVGICSAIQLRCRFWNTNEKFELSWRKGMPLIAGFALLGLLGTSPHADLMAHLAGFAVGLVVGYAAGLKRNPPLNKLSFWVQLTAAVLAFGVMTGAWLQGQFHNG
jgi:rhomboid protease GluP